MNLNEAYSKIYNRHTQAVYNHKLNNVALSFGQSHPQIAHGTRQIRPRYKKTAHSTQRHSKGYTAGTGPLTPWRRLDGI